MSQCRRCNARDAVVAKMCKNCHEKWQIDQCISGIRTYINYMKNEPAKIQRQHMVELVLIRREIGDIIDSLASNVLKR